MEIQSKKLVNEISDTYSPDGKSHFSLQNYILQEKVGSGAFGNVFKVKDKTTGIIYAAKISKEAIESESTDLLLSLTREVNIISKLNHPTILKFIGFSGYNFKSKPKPVIITEFVSNGSLEDLI